MSKNIQHKVDQYYTAKVREFGTTSKGVDWNDEDSQFLRFEQLMKVSTSTSDFSILDYGCGFGSLLDYFRKHQYQNIKYQGYDISEEMIGEANRSNESDYNVFHSDYRELKPADYGVASGIFNVRLDVDNQDWEAYIYETLDNINSLCTRGFSFNLLSIYSDVEFRSDHLYYADPAKLFDHCKRNYAFDVALLHDYGLYEFTIIVRKELD